MRDILEAQETPAEEQRRKSDMDARANRAVAERVNDSQIEQDYPTSPQSAFRTQRKKDEENDQKNKSGSHSLNKPQETNRPSAA